MCDDQEDANLIVVSFRGTEPFDADDWITDFDYTWYEFPELGKVHMGFLEALGLGTRENTNSFQMHLQAKPPPPHTRNRKDLIPPMGTTTAYYTVRNKVEELLKQHEKAKFVVTGHSLGGALAILFPTVLLMHREEEMMQRMLGIYTFGQPRIGDRELARYVKDGLERLHIRYQRVVYCTGLVPRLPFDDKTFLYKHFGPCLYYNSLYMEKEVDEEPNSNAFGLAYLIPDHVIAVLELLRSLVMEYVYGADYRETWESVMLSPKVSIRGNEIVAVEPAETPKPRRGRQPKDKEGKATKSAKTPRAGKRSAKAVIKEEINSDAYNGWSHEQMESDEEYLDKQVSWKDNLGLNQINFDESAMPVPVCSCTGSPQPCYRWGNGGWQSACFTTTISMYPLPQVANKRYSRVGGRKMSGSAFNKLLNRLASEGYNFSSPLDLKDHWAKHGNRVG
ncbi:hypothetical protein OROMI_008213 [Orobanche minor]